MLTINDIDLQQVDAVIFDLDGTIYDKSGLAGRLAAKQVGRIGMLSREQYARKVLRGKFFGSEDEFYKAFFDCMANNNKVIARMARFWYFRDFMPAMVTQLSENFTVEPWVEDLVFQLSMADKKVARQVSLFFIWKTRK